MSSILKSELGKEFLTLYRNRKKEDSGFPQRFAAGALSELEGSPISPNKVLVDPAKYTDDVDALLQAWINRITEGDFSGSSTFVADPPSAKSTPGETEEENRFDPSDYEDEEPEPEPEPAPEPEQEPAPDAEPEPAKELAEEVDSPPDTPANPMDLVVQGLMEITQGKDKAISEGDVRKIVRDELKTLLRKANITINV